MDHPFKRFRTADMFLGHDDNVYTKDCEEYLQNIAGNQCRRLRRKPHESEFHDCSCLKFLEGKPTRIKAVAQYMVYHYRLSATERRRTLLDWVKYTQRQHHKQDDNLPRFYTPFVPLQEINTEEECEEMSFDWNNHLICKAALGALLDVGYKKWLGLKAGAKANEIPRHGLTGRKGNHSLNPEVRNGVVEYFKELEQLASPRTTRILRELTGVGLRDGEDGVTELPPHFSKRQLFYKYVQDRGWDVSVNDRGSLKLIKRQEETVECTPVCSLDSFLNIWKTSFPKLIIRNPSEDICTICHVYLNRWRYIEASDKKRREDIRDSIIEDVTTEINDAQLPAPRRITRGTKRLKSFVFQDDTDLSPKQQLLRDAFLHVERAIGQRDLCNKSIDEAREDFEAKKPHSESRRCIVIDYSQNGELPQLGDSQPGKAYYYSPVNISIFGIVNCEVDKGALTAFVYHEGQGKKGGNNVASMVWLFLQNQGWLQKDVRGKQLTIIMDNCAGQNKNNTVLRLAPLLVELGYFETVNCIFYVVGHTKNACDQWFNTLKRSYQRKDIWSMEQLLEYMRTNTAITVCEIKPGDFRDWNTYLDKLYSKIDTGKTSKGHMFVSTSGSDKYTPTTLEIREDDLEYSRTKPHFQEMNPLLAERKRKMSDSLKKRKEEEREAALDNIDNIRVLPPPGLTLERRVQLGTLWRALCPQEYKDYLCKEPSAEDLTAYKKKAKSKRDAKKEASSSKKTKSKDTNKTKDSDKNNTTEATNSPVAILNLASSPI